MRRVHVIYHGRVQGIGFRATVRRLASAHPVTGFVQNLADGTVELELQGETVFVDRVLADIQREFIGFLTDEDRSAMPETTDDSGFVVRY